MLSIKIVCEICIRINIFRSVLCWSETAHVSWIIKDR